MNGKKQKSENPQRRATVPDNVFRLRRRGVWREEESSSSSVSLGVPTGIARHYLFIYLHPQILFGSIVVAPRVRDTVGIKIPKHLGPLSQLLVNYLWKCNCQITVTANYISFVNLSTANYGYLIDKVRDNLFRTKCTEETFNWKLPCTRTIINSFISS